MTYPWKAKTKLFNEEDADHVLQRVLIARARSVILTIEPPDDEATEEEVLAAQLITSILQNLHISNRKSVKTNSTVFPGLINEWKYCYLNTGLQLTLLSPRILESVKTLTINQKLDETQKAALQGIQLVAEFFGHSSLHHKERLDLSVRQFHLTSANAFGFTPGCDEDMSEFLLRLFNLLNENSSHLLDCCKHSSEKICNGCSRPDGKAEQNEYIRSVQVKGGARLDEMIGNCLDTPKCCPDETLKVVLTKCPQYMYIQINRMLENQQKCMDPVRLEKEVHVEYKCDPLRGDTAIAATKYKLIGAGCHSGREGHTGHFYAVVWSETNKHWLKISDSNIEIFSESILLRNVRNDICFAVLEREGENPTSEHAVVLKRGRENQDYSNEGAKKARGGDIGQPSMPDPDAKQMQPKSVEGDENTESKVEPEKEQEFDSAEEGEKEPEKKFVWGPKAIIEAAARFFLVSKPAEGND